MNTKSVNDYCDTCNAPRNNAVERLIRCGTCLVINGKLPPTKHAITPSIAEDEGVKK